MAKTIEEMFLDFLKERQSGGQRGSDRVAVMADVRARTPNSTVAFRRIDEPENSRGVNIVTERAAQIRNSGGGFVSRGDFTGALPEHDSDVLAANHQVLRARAMQYVSAGQSVPASLLDEMDSSRSMLRKARPATLTTDGGAASPGSSKGAPGADAATIIVGPDGTTSEKKSTVAGPSWRAPLVTAPAKPDLTKGVFQTDEGGFLVRGGVGVDTVAKGVSSVTERRLRGRVRAGIDSSVSSVGPTPDDMEQIYGELGVDQGLIAPEDAKYGVTRIDTPMATTMRGNYWARNYQGKRRGSLTESGGIVL